MIRVLLIEDDPNDAALVAESLKTAPLGPFSLQSVPTLAAGIERASQGELDAVLLDLSLPDGTGLETLSRARAKITTIPIIVMTGYKDEALALTALKQGAQDYLFKDDSRPDTLSRAIRFAIERKAHERVREEFFHSVNHELRTPISAVYGALMGLQEEAASRLAPEERQLLEIALRGATHLVDLTEDLANLLRSSHGTLAVHPVPASLPALISDSLSWLALSKRAPHVTLSEENEADLPAGLVDPLRFRQILINLLVNAAKAARRGGRVTVRAARAPGEPGFLTVSVADNGQGFAETGTGPAVGLRLCRDLISRQGGVMKIESERGKGSVFRFTVPVAGA